MVEYLCLNCDKIFDRKSNYVYHMNRKVPCVLQPITMDKLKEETNEKLELKEKRIINLEETVKNLANQVEQLLIKKDEV